MRKKKKHIHINLFFFFFLDNIIMYQGWKHESLSNGWNVKISSSNDKVIFYCRDDVVAKYDFSFFSSSSSLPKDSFSLPSTIIVGSDPLVPDENVWESVAFVRKQEDRSSADYHDLKRALNRLLPFILVTLVVEYVVDDSFWVIHSVKNGIRIMNTSSVTSCRYSSYQKNLFSSGFVATYLGVSGHTLFLNPSKTLFAIRTGSGYLSPEDCFKCAQESLGGFPCTSFLPAKNLDSFATLFTPSSSFCLYVLSDCKNILSVITMTKSEWLKWMKLKEYLETMNEQEEILIRIVKLDRWIENFHINHPSNSFDSIFSSQARAFHSFRYRFLYRLTNSEVAQYFFPILVECFLYEQQKREIGNSDFGFDIHTPLYCFGSNIEARRIMQDIPLPKKSPFHQPCLILLVNSSTSNEFAVFSHHLFKFLKLVSYYHGILLTDSRQLVKYVKKKNSVKKPRFNGFLILVCNNENDLKQISMDYPNGEFLESIVRIKHSDQQSQNKENNDCIFLDPNQSTSQWIKTIFKQVPLFSNVDHHAVATLLLVATAI